MQGCPLLWCNTQCCVVKKTEKSVIRDAKELETQAGLSNSGFHRLPTKKASGVFHTEVPNVNEQIGFHIKRPAAPSRSQRHHQCVGAW